MPLARSVTGEFQYVCEADRKDDADPQYKTTFYLKTLSSRDFSAASDTMAKQEYTATTQLVLSKGLRGWDQLYKLDSNGAPQLVPFKKDAQQGGASAESIWALPPGLPLELAGEILRVTREGIDADKVK